MIEMVAEGTPPMSVPRDSREEALLICEAKQSDNCLVSYLETLIKEKVQLCCIGSGNKKAPFKLQDFCIYTEVGEYLNSNTMCLKFAHYTGIL